jgi:hypothetical protein
LLWAKSQLETFPNSWRDRFLAIGIYRHAVNKKESIKDSAKKLGVSTTSVIMATILLYIYKCIFKIG